MQLYLDLTNSTAWREGLSDEEAIGQCKQAAWAARANELQADAEDALEIVKRAPSEDAFRALFLPWSYTSPSLKIVFDWRQKHPPVPMPHRNVDEHLSSFGNLVSRFLNTLDDDFQVACLHKDIFLAFAASLDVYEHSYSLKYHVLFSGASA